MQRMRESEGIIPSLKSGGGDRDNVCDWQTISSAQGWTKATATTPTCIGAVRANARLGVTLLHLITVSLGTRKNGVTAFTGNMLVAIMMRTVARRAVNTALGYRVSYCPLLRMMTFLNVFKIRNVKSVYCLHANCIRISMPSLRTCK